MIIIVGLGNPLPKPEKSRGGPRVTFTGYHGTRHNVGQEIISHFQKIKNFPDFKFKKKFESLISEGRIDNEKIILVLPQTFMNESGRAVKKIATSYKLQATSILVVHDDIDLPLGKIRIRQDGSSGGHNGVQSIIDYLKNKDFIRFKIGIANKKREKIPAGKFVLKKFEKEEKEIIVKVIKKSCEIIEKSLKEKIKNQSISV